MLKSSTDNTDVGLEDEEFGFIYERRIFIYIRSYYQKT